MEILKAFIKSLESFVLNLRSYVSAQKVEIEYVEPVFIEPPKPELPLNGMDPKWYVPNPSNSYGEYPLTLKRKLYQRVREICDEEGLTLQLKEDLCATIWGESSWNPYAINQQTKDYGLCQFSEKYYCKEYKMTPEDAVNQPERCARIMARNFKAGRQSNWVAYAHRAKYLYLKP